MPTLTSAPASPQQAFVAQMQRWGLSGLAAAMLEHGGAFGLLAAQSLHVAAPFLEPWVERTTLRNLAAAIEDPAQRANLIRQLNIAQ